ncbi:MULTISPECIES: ABC transporter ATP-binding protein [unclassified Streptomyces]|uniref:ABC transporter ATP-binding protein n=1 Tax=unclassified Streptomyces TaxID=2593676 RepID=UPI002E15A5E7|nr:MULTISPECIES: ATP-binding cassette domain-containing protein [unclassified Streptomyces]WSR09786.1 ATP-binding cassette domain-containing protein [Streptomyces sp. NBC_01208]WSR47490.1 ATP-binding cassette domain-containing protein [Streptomyces sp. NBC_01201]
MRIVFLRPLRAAGPVLLTALLTLLLLQALLPAATALAMGELVGRVRGVPGEELWQAVLWPLLAFTGLLLGTHLLECLTEPLDFLARARADGDHRRRLLLRAAGTPTLEVLERPGTRQLLRTAAADPENWTERKPSDGAVAQLRLLCAAVGFGASAVVLAGYAWWAVPVLVVPAVALRVHFGRSISAFVRRWLAGTGAWDQMMVWASALASGGAGKDVRVFGLGEWMVGRMRHHLLEMFEPVWREHIRHLWRCLAHGAVVLAVLLCVFVPAASSAAGGESTVAAATAALSAGWSLFTLAEYCDPRDVVGARACLEATAELERLLPVRPAAGAADLAEGPFTVRFEDVSFRYPGTDRTVLDRLDLEIAPGELLAIVGMNGAGKSTLIKLLAGLYTPTSGRITAGGTDLADLGPETWRRHVSMVFQDFVRYELSAAENVVLGRADRPRDEQALARAAADAGLSPVLQRLPAGWDTPLARSRTGGVDLSGGQWQQIVLARALYAVHSGAGLLVLDEPTAHLDVRTEFDVFARLARRRGDTGVVLISHRLSTVRQADRIVLLDGGRITEQGTHDELMALGGTYAEMFHIQAERFRRGYDDRLDGPPDDRPGTATTQGESA